MKTKTVINTFEKRFCVNQVLVEELKFNLISDQNQDHGSRWIMSYIMGWYLMELIRCGIGISKWICIKYNVI